MLFLMKVVGSFFILYVCMFTNNLYVNLRIDLLSMTFELVSYLKINQHASTMTIERID